MTEHRLNALHASSPLGFLAGLGTLVVAARRQELGDVRLAWETAPPHPARLWATTPDPASLAKAVFDGLMDQSSPLPKNVTGTRGFKELTLVGCRKQFDKLTGSNAALLAAMVSDATKEEKPVRGPLVMTGGPQDFTAEVKKLRAAVKKAGAEALRTALFGPWQYEDGHPLGFDPLMERQHAYLGAKPERDTRRVPGAVLLAITALELLPLYPAASRGGITNVLFHDRHWETMSWPVWENPLDLDSIASLLSVRREWRDGSPSQGGIIAEFAAERKDAGKEGSRYSVLRQARRLS